jgi:hypothetical protein
LIGYTGKGIYEAFHKEHKDGVEDHVMAARVADGLLDLQAAMEEEKASILEMWEKSVNVVDVDPKVRKKDKNREKKGKRQDKG